MKIEQLQKRADALLEKFNPYHDDKGLFSSGEGGGGGTQGKGKLGVAADKLSVAAERASDKAVRSGSKASHEKAINAHIDATHAHLAAARATGSKTQEAYHRGLVDYHTQQYKNHDYAARRL